LKNHSLSKNLICPCDNIPGKNWTSANPVTSLIYVLFHYDTRQSTVIYFKWQELMSPPTASNTQIGGGQSCVKPVAAAFHHLQGFCCASANIFSQKLKSKSTLKYTSLSLSLCLCGGRSICTHNQCPHMWIHIHTLVKRSNTATHKIHSYQIWLVCIHKGQCSRVPHQLGNMIKLETVHLEQ
jgi:hypothetical protein